MTRLSALRDIFPHGEYHGQSAGVYLSEPVAGETTLVLSVLHLENNVLSGQFDTRIPLNGTRENTTDVLTQRVKAAGLDVVCDYRAPHHVPAETPLVQELMRCYEIYTGHRAESLAMGGSTYVHHVPGGVAFGCLMPDAEDRMHAADEYTNLDDLILSAQMFAQAIADLCE